MGAEINTPIFDRDVTKYQYSASYDYFRYYDNAKTRHQAINANAQVASTSSNQCQDDERLQNLHDLIGVAQIQDQITPLVKMSYHTYLNMDQEVRSMIAGGDDALNLDLFDDNCNSIMLIDGAPIDNIEMSFNNIYKTILGYQEKGDLESIATLYKTVKAKPESIEKIMDWVLNVNPDIFETPTTCYLQELGAVRVGLAKYNSDTPIANACDGVTIANQPSKIDLFAAFGGRVVEKGVKLNLFLSGKNYSKQVFHSIRSSARSTMNWVDEDHYRKFDHLSAIIQGVYKDQHGLDKPIKRDIYEKRYKNNIDTGKWLSEGDWTTDVWANNGFKDNAMALMVRALELNIKLKLDGWLNDVMPKQSTKAHEDRLNSYNKKIEEMFTQKVQKPEIEVEEDIEVEGGDLEAEEME